MTSTIEFNFGEMLSAIINEPSGNISEVLMSNKGKCCVEVFSSGLIFILELWRYLVVCSYLGLSSFLSGRIYPIPLMPARRRRDLKFLDLQFLAALTEIEFGFSPRVNSKWVIICQ